MTYLNHAIERQAELAANILKCFSNAEQLTTKVVGVEEFQKSYTDETHSIVPFEVVQKYGNEQIQKANKLSGDAKKELLQKATDEINSFEVVNVVAENGSNKAFFVKSKPAKKLETEKTETTEKTDEEKEKEAKEKSAAGKE